MKNPLKLTILVISLTAAVSLGQSEPLANEGAAGLYARSIEHVLRMEPEQVDLAAAALIISERWSKNVHGRRYLQRLDDMALEIRNRLRAKRVPPNRAMLVINEYLFDELGFKSVKEATNPNDLFLHTVLDKRRGYCLSLSILYLSLAERLDLPIYGVVIPGHFFVRYDDGRDAFNIETTSKGGTASDEHYITKFKVPMDYPDSIYMVNLDKVQTLGCLLNNLGNTYSNIGDAEAALVALETAVRINPTLGESHMNLGNIYLKKGWVTDAIHEYHTALEINPSEAKTYFNLGNAYAKQERLNNAVTEYLQSLELDPNCIETYQALAMAYSRQEMFGQAILRLKQAIMLKPKDSTLYSQLGDVYSQRGDYQQAISQYKRALGIKPRSADAHYGLGTCYNQLGLIDEEIQAYKNALAIQPDMLAALMNLGNAYFTKEDYDAAITQYKKAALVKPDESTVFYNLGAAYSNKGDYEKAVVEYAKAIKLEPEMANAHNGLAYGFYMLNDYESAWKHIKLAEQLGADIDEKLLKAIEASLPKE